MRRRAIHTIAASLLPAIILLASCASTPPEPPIAEGSPTPVAAGPTTSAATPTTAQPTEPAPTAVPTAASGLPFPTATAVLPTKLITDTTMAALQPLRSIGLGRARVVAISPNNTLLVAATTAGLALFDLPSLTLLRFDSGQGDPYQLTISPDGKLFAIVIDTNGSDGLVTELRSIATGEVVATLDGSTPAWSPDGSLLTLERYSDNQPKTYLYRSDGSTIGEALDGTGAVFSPDGSLIATSASPALDQIETRLYRVSDGSPAGTVAGSSPTWSPDSQTLATAVESVITLWRMPSGEELGKLEATATNEYYLVPTLAFSADGTRLYEVNHFDLRTWDLSTGNLVESTPDALRPTMEMDNGGPTLFSPDGSILAAFSPPIEGQYYGVRLFKTEGNQQIYVDTDSGSIAYSKDSTLAALLSAEGLVQVVNLADGTARALDVPGYSGIAFNPNGSTLAAAGSQTTLWDVAAGTQQRTLVLDNLFGLYGTSRVEFSPDGTSLGVVTKAGSEGIVFNSAHLWDLTGGDLGKTVWERSEFASAIIFSAFSPANGSVASSYESADVTVLAGGTVTTTFTLPLTVTALAFNPIGTQIAAGDAGGAVALRDLAGSGEPIQLESAEGEVTELAYSPDGLFLAAHLVSEIGEGRVLIWRVDQPGLLVNIAADAEVARLMFTSDSETLAVAGPNGVAFYNVDGGTELTRLDIAAEDIAIGPGRRLIAVLSGERVVLYGVK